MLIQIFLKNVLYLKFLIVFVGLQSLYSWAFGPNACSFKLNKKYVLFKETLFYINGALLGGGGPYSY